MGNCVTRLLHVTDPPSPSNTREIKVGTTIPAKGNIVTPNLKNFTLTELKAITRNFRPATLVGEGGFGQVYKGWVDEKTLAPAKIGFGLAVAVKKSVSHSSQGLQEWKAEVEFLGKLSHPNLVKLVGYCWEENQYLLVYEYMHKGSLENHLFQDTPEPLSWERRLKIAIGAAEGLAFLHSLEKSIIYRDFKASNILLDSGYNARLSDFGLARLGPANGSTHVSTQVKGTFGYTAPEYRATGHLYLKSDVYSFGVVLLEILTGLRAIDLARTGEKFNLVEWTRPHITQKRKLKKIMDSTLENNYSIKAAFVIAQLITKCLEEDHRKRPSMEQVLHDLYISFDMQEKPKVQEKRPGR